jgi:hypothetical protein
MAIRDLGRGIIDLVRPDGGRVLEDTFPTMIPKGIATRATDLTAPRAADFLNDGVSKVEQNPNIPDPQNNNLPSIVQNPLEEFASVTPLWTLACLTPEQFNNPASYRNSTGDLKNVIFASGGRFDDQRQSTLFGTPEYFVNNFIMKAIVAAGGKTGNSNAFKFEFDIYEPYSMGLLLQSMQAAALNAGYLNYMENCPYLLRLDFNGYKEDGTILTSIKPKFFTMKFTSVKFQVTESGSQYKVEAIPYNHQGFTDTVNVLYNELKIIASTEGTVEDILVNSPESLIAALNKIEQNMVDEQKIGYPDVYDIQFPQNSSDFASTTKPPQANAAVVDPNAPPDVTIQGDIVPSILRTKLSQAKLGFTSNDIGKASLGFTQSSGGNFVMKKEGDQRDEKTGIVNRDGMTIDPNKRAFQFGQNQSLTAMINRIILSSDYAKKAMDPKNLVGGYIRWFRLDVQIELLKYDPLVGDYARKITYRVVPFLVHHSVFTNPNAAIIGYQDIKKQICKAYEYIYSGQNLNVLKFDININNLFYTGSSSSAENKSAQVSNQDQKGPAEDPAKTTKNNQGTAPEAQTATLGRSRVKRDPKLLGAPPGGSGDRSTEQMVAEQFQRAFIEGSSADMISVDLEILGDTYWIVDSGLSNYFAASATPSSQITEDGTMNYESGEVYIYITFRTPSDISETTGLFDFPQVSPFSGIYKVVNCESQFNDGLFKQKIKCLRMQGQAIDYADNPAGLKNIKSTKQGALSVTIAEEETIKTSPIDETFPSVLRST